MKRVTPCDPNFEVMIVTHRKRVSRELHAASSEAELVRRLQQRVEAGVILSFEIQPYDFESWRKKARKETARVIWAKRRNEPYDFDAHRQIWGEMKDHLRVLFHGKCAYCDAKLDTVAWGDVEHYRPKRKVTDRDGETIAHPGYYWLAYDLDNLLPSCQLCNQAKGKGNRFPLRDENARRRNPGRRLEAEEPLLFNAYRHETEKHLKFVPGSKDKAFGTVAGIDDVGITSEEVYDLNREPLIDARRERQNAARAKVKEALSREEPAVITQLVRDCMEGRTEFAAAVLTEVESYFDTMGIKLIDR